MAARRKGPLLLVTVFLLLQLWIHLQWSLLNVSTGMGHGGGRKGTVSTVPFTLTVSSTTKDGTLSSMDTKAATTLIHSFPSIEERIEYYLGFHQNGGNCNNTRRIPFVRNGALVTVNGTTVRGVVNLHTLRQTNESLAAALLPLLDLQTYKYDPTAPPLVVETLGPIPHLGAQRPLSNKSSETSTTILWDFWGRQAIGRLPREDLPWKEKRQEVAIIHSLKNETRQFYLQHKALLVTSDDTKTLMWGLFSNSIVFMNEPIVASWIMPDKLVPWVHYVPCNNSSLIPQLLSWVLKHDDQAQGIVKRASLWIHNMYYDVNATRHHQIIADALMKYYRAQFESKERMITNTSDGIQTSHSPPSDLQLVLNRSSIPGTSRERSHAAVCYKSLFGAVDLHRFIQWAGYHYLLGFDRIFVWYLPTVAYYRGFDVLQQMPFVTLLPNSHGRVQEARPGYERVVPTFDQALTEMGDQRSLERVCLLEVARDYKWVLFADADEYLWLNSTLPQFLRRHDQYRYISVGKKMYTRQFAVNITRDTGFGLDAFAFTTGRYCFAKPKHARAKRLHYLGQPVCPLHFGRAKVMVRPKYYSRVNIHGTHMPQLPHEVHLHSDIAHFKEWPGIFMPASPQIVPPQSFVVSGDIGLGLHHSLEKAHLPNANGTFNVTYDADLSDWFAFVMHH